MDFYHVNDRRMHRRFAVTIAARLYHAGGRVSPCSTVNLSLAGATVQLSGSCPAPVTGFGCDETGKLAVTRFHVAEPFVRLVFDTSEETRAVIKRALKALGDRHLIQPLPPRRGERLSTRQVMLTRADGSHLQCDILDMSPKGMLLACATRPPLGERISLGKVAGIVARHHPDGFAIRIQMPANGARSPANYRTPARQPSSSFDGLA